MLIALLPHRNALLLQTSSCIPLRESPPSGSLTFQSHVSGALTSRLQWLAQYHRTPPTPRDSRTALDPVIPHFDTKPCPLRYASCTQASKATPAMSTSRSTPTCSSGSSRHGTSTPATHRSLPGSVAVPAILQCQSCSPRQVSNVLTAYETNTDLCI